ncbi:MAG: translation elongation factor-like protein [Candidatus Omnitrophica bacterium]|nr:translation elongation factor-like protein [Candidatus Omnitrophota bacterium]
MANDWIEIGLVTNYYSKPLAAIIEITAGSLKVGDKIKIQGHTTNFEMVVDSMQIEHHSVDEVLPGQILGLKVKERVRIHDRVFKEQKP